MGVVLLVALETILKRVPPKSNTQFLAQIWGAPDLSKT